MNDGRDQSGQLRAAIRDGNAMRAAKAARRAAAQPTTVLVCGEAMEAPEARQRMKEWLQEECRKDG